MASIAKLKVRTMQLDENTGEQYQDHWIEPWYVIQKESMVSVYPLTHTKWWKNVPSKVQVPYAR